MRNRIRFSLTIILLVLGVASHPVFSTPITITDMYHGADDHGYGDVIGKDHLYSVQSMDVHFGSGQLMIDVYSRYFDNIGSDGTGLGDLFISTNGWNPHGSQPYLNDDASNGESWEFGLKLDDYGATSGDFFLYDTTPANSAVLSFAPSGYIWRDGQEVRVNASEANLLFLGSAGTWSIQDNGTSVDTDDYMRFMINNTAFNSYFAGVQNYGFHWGMTCANDVIEGGAVIPEPSTVLLLGLGLIGVGGYARVRRHKRS